MEYKPAAGIFVGGVTMSICGPVLGVASGFFASWAIARGDSGMAAVFFAIVGLGALLALIGFFVLIAAAHRALVKIDALPTHALGYNSESVGRSGSSRVS